MENADAHHRQELWLEGDVSKDLNRMDNGKERTLWVALDARVYALDLPALPGEEFKAVARYVEGFETGARLDGVCSWRPRRDQPKDDMEKGGRDW